MAFTLLLLHAILRIAQAMVIGIAWMKLDVAPMLKELFLNLLYDINVQ